LSGCGVRRQSMAMLRGFIALVAVWTATIASGVSLLQAQEGSVVNREYEIKAAYLYQFGHYIQWPDGSFEDDQSPFVIGVLGVDPFHGALDDIAGEKKIAERKIVIKRFASLADYTPCHILFVTSSFGDMDNISTIQHGQKYPVMLVGESPGFAEHGGTINFFIEGNRLRFEVNMDVAKRQQLKCSSKMLRLAKIIGSL
jgi:hypothetical protein